MIDGYFRWFVYWIGIVLFSWRIKRYRMGRYWIILLVPRTYCSLYFLVLIPLMLWSLFVFLLGQGCLLEEIVKILRQILLYFVRFYFPLLFHRYSLSLWIYIHFLYLVSLDDVRARNESFVLIRMVWVPLIKWPFGFFGGTRHLVVFDWDLEWQRFRIRL